MNESEIIINQYRTVVGKLDEMFGELDRRSYGALWKQEGPLKGVGSCAGLLTQQIEEGLTGIARKKLIELRAEKGNSVPGQGSSKTKCDFHREGMGCALGDLKSPLCISHIDDGWELGIVFGINGFSLERDVRWILDNILTAKDPFSGTKLGSAIDNNGFVKDACQAIALMTSHFKKFPIQEN